MNSRTVIIHLRAPLRALFFTGLYRFIQYFCLICRRCCNRRLVFSLPVAIVDKIISWFYLFQYFHSFANRPKPVFKNTGYWHSSRWEVVSYPKNLTLIRKNNQHNGNFNQRPLLCPFLWGRPLFVTGLDSLSLRTTSNFL